MTSSVIYLQLNLIFFPRPSSHHFTKLRFDIFILLPFLTNLQNIEYITIYAKNDPDPVKLIHESKTEKEQSVCLNIIRTD